MEVGLAILMLVSFSVEVRLISRVRLLRIMLGSYKAILPDCFGYVFTTRSKDNAGFIQSDFVGLHAYDRFFCALPVPCLFTV